LLADELPQPIVQSLFQHALMRPAEILTLNLRKGH
jgi:hypothetical protein